MDFLSFVARLTEMKTEKERTKAEMKDLQQQLSDMHDELDQAKKADVIHTDKEVLLKVQSIIFIQMFPYASKHCYFFSPLCGLFAGFGAAARGLPGDASDERGAGGGAAPFGEGA